MCFFPILPPPERPDTYQVVASPYPPSGHAEVQFVAQGQAQPVRVTMPIPPHVVVAREPRVGWWDAEQGVWSEEEVAGIAFDATARQLTFSTLHLAPLALIQPRTADLPYTGWQLRPTGPASALLQVDTQRLRVELAVTEAGCMLVAPPASECPELDRLRSSPMSPGIILMELERSGIVLRPRAGDAQRLSAPSAAAGDAAPIGAKLPAFESQLYADLARAAPAFAYAGSRWNKDRGERAAVMRAREVAEEEVRGEPSVVGVVAGSLESVLVAAKTEEVRALSEPYRV